MFKSVCLSLLGVVLCAGCKQKEPTATAGSASGLNATNFTFTNHPITATATTILQTNFSVPFRGTIKAREQRDLLLHRRDITYTIGEQKIRRETVRTAPVGKLADLGMGVGAAGVICDLQTERVTLYRSEQGKKAFVRMNLSDYRKLVVEPSTLPPLGVGALTPLATRPRYWKHVGTFCVDIPRPLSPADVANEPDARTVRGVPCDVLTIKTGDILFEISHSQRIKVDRQLIDLVELRLPAEVTGFPCLMRRLQRVPVQATNQTSRSRQIIQKTVRWVADTAEKALHREIELLEITEQVPPDAAFTLDNGFAELPTLAELDRQFQPPPSHRDYDD